MCFLSSEILIRSTDNASATISYSSIRPSPNLQVAVFDPAFTSTEQALNSGYSPLNLFNANGNSYINLNLNLYKSINVAPVYYYGAQGDRAYRAKILISGYRSLDLD